MADEREHDPSADAEASATGAAASPTGATQTPPPGWYRDPNNPAQQRYWDGQQWTQNVQAGATASLPAVSTERKTADERKALLAQQVQFLVAQGRRVESQSEFQAVLVQGKPINHTLHALLTIFTCLLWGIVWIILGATGGEKREMVVVDEFGNVQHQHLGKPR